MLIKNAKIVSSKGIYAGDILVEGERIKKVGKGISSGGEQVIDASGLHAFFGATDAHVHFRVPGGEKKEDFYTGTCSAIAGGVTAVLDMPNTRPPTTTRNALEEKISTASSTSVCDFGFHFGATQGNLEDVKKTNPSTKTGLANAKRRLDLLYPDKHKLKIESSNDEYTVDLSLLYDKN